jgi:hypothetical protein
MPARVLQRHHPSIAGLKLPADRSVLGLEPGDKVALDGFVPVAYEGVPCGDRGPLQLSGASQPPPQAHVRPFLDDRAGAYHGSAFEPRIRPHVVLVFYALTYGRINLLGLKANFCEPIQRITAKWIG